MSHVLPDINVLIAPLIGTPYGNGLDCWSLVYGLIKQGWGLDLAGDVHEAATAFTEMWYHGDARDPITLVQPWDVLVMVKDLDVPISDHVGLVIDTRTFVHAMGGTVGVALGRLQRWQPKVLQLVRLRRALAYGDRLIA